MNRDFPEHLRVLEETTRLLVEGGYTQVPGDMDITEQAMRNTRSDLNFGRGVAVEIPDSPMRIFDNLKRVVGVVVFRHWRHLELWWGTAEGILVAEMAEHIRGPKSREGYLVLLCVENAEPEELQGIHHDTSRTRKIVAAGRELVHYESWVRKALAPVLPIQENVVDSSPRWALSNITLRGFRGFTDSAVDLSGGVVIVTGTNGVGKSSLMDGVLWALTGASLHGNASAVRNKYAAATPTVRLDLVDDHGDTLTVTRRHHSAGSRVDARHGVQRETGADAQTLIASLLWPPSRHAADPYRSFVKYLTTCVFPSRNSQPRLPTTEQDGQDLYQLLEEITKPADGETKRSKYDFGKPERLVQEINNALGTHPGFSVSRLVTRVDAEHPQTLIVVDDPTMLIGELAPETVLSYTQQKKLALATAFGLNLAAGQGLGVVVLDDPFHSLDTVSILSLCDAVRSVSAHRQVVLSTHDERCGNLLDRKMRPVGTEKTIRIKIEHWDRNGPALTCRALGTSVPPLLPTDAPRQTATAGTH